LEETFVVVGFRVGFDDDGFFYFYLDSCNTDMGVILRCERCEELNRSYVIRMKFSMFKVSFECNVCGLDAGLGR
jgi:hypothetical protein